MLSGPLLVSFEFANLFFGCCAMVYQRPARTKTTKRMPKYRQSFQGVWVPLTPPFLRRRFVVNIPLVNPLFKSVSCVPPPRVGAI